MKTGMYDSGACRKKGRLGEKKRNASRNNSHHHQKIIGDDWGERRWKGKTRTGKEKKSAKRRRGVDRLGEFRPLNERVSRATLERYSSRDAKKGKASEGEGGRIISLRNEGTKVRRSKEVWEKVHGTVQLGPAVPIPSDLTDLKN